jgi:hypothetical protein
MGGSGDHLSSTSLDAATRRERVRQRVSHRDEGDIMQVSGRSPDIITVTDSGKHEVQTCSQPVSVTVSARHAATLAVVCIVP